MLKSLLENVFVRLVLYCLSPVVGTLAGWGVGWIVISFDGVDWITIKFSVQGFVGALVAALGLSGGIFAKFGTR